MILCFSHPLITLLLPSRRQWPRNMSRQGKAKPKRAAGGQSWSGALLVPALVVLLLLGSLVLLAMLMSRAPANLTTVETCHQRAIDGATCGTSPKPSLPPTAFNKREPLFLTCIRSVGGREGLVEAFGDG
jgi:hypothetical protein